MQHHFAFLKVNFTILSNYLFLYGGNKFCPFHQLGYSFDYRDCSFYYMLFFDYYLKNQGSKIENACLCGCGWFFRPPTLGILWFTLFLYFTSYEPSVLSRVGWRRANRSLIYNGLCGRRQSGSGSPPFFSNTTKERENYCEFSLRCREGWRSAFLFGLFEN